LFDVKASSHSKNSGFESFSKRRQTLPNICKLSSMVFAKWTAKEKELFTAILFEQEHFPWKPL